MSNKHTGILLSIVFTIAFWPAFSSLGQGIEALPSVAGLFPIENQGRQVWNFNSDWLFHLGDASGAEQIAFDDSSWERVSTPHSVKLEPAEASGCRNYQGVAWYRKHFVVPAERTELHFEAVMGKQRFYVNGKLAQEHLGGYLPVSIDLTQFGLTKGDTCIIAVMADNSNDNSYPPGKPQYTLDFAYHGGIYRDVWLIGKNEVSITDPVVANKQAGAVSLSITTISLSAVPMSLLIQTCVM